MMERGLRLLALLRLDRLHDAAHRKQRVEPRRLDPGQALGPLGHRLRLRQGRLVQPNLGLLSFALHGEVDGAIAARQPLLTKAPRPDLEGLEAGREAQANVEIAAVDAAGFPRPARFPVHALGAGEAGHALKRHGVSLYQCEACSAAFIAESRGVSDRKLTPSVSDCGAVSAPPRPRRP